jgi:hypothetical protein
MITVDMTRKELQDALRFQLELEQAVEAYRKLGYEFSTDNEQYQLCWEAKRKLEAQKAEVSRINSLLRGYIR